MSRLTAAAWMALTAAFAAGCTSTDALDPSAINAPQTAAPALPAAMQPGAAAAATPATAPVATAAVPQQSASLPPAVGPGGARFVLAPIVGAPEPAAAPLSQRLGTSAKSKRFAIVDAADATATHTLKGFFSTSPEGAETVVYYVWDVIDRAGNRVHRFSGQVRTPGTQGWASVTEQTMQQVADKTAADVVAWLSGRPS